MRRSNSQTYKESYELIITEQHRDNDYMQKIYERAGSKENVLLAATFGIIAYLYSTPSGKGSGIIDRLSIPREDYGLVIYVIAAAFFLYGFFKLMFNVFGDNSWSTAYESNKQSYSNNPAKTAKYIKSRYDTIHSTNLASHIKRKRDLKICFFCILISAIILIVIKTLG